jgi:putative hemolysin
VSLSLQILAVLLIVLGNAFFVAAEYALVTARRSRLEELAQAGNLRARVALRIMNDPIRFIGTVQLGITFFSLLLGAVGEPIVEKLFHPIISVGIAFILAFAIVTYLHVTLGELAPKAIALEQNEKTALWVALPVEAFYLATYPLVWFLQSSANAFTRLFGVRPGVAGETDVHSEAELKMFLRRSSESGEIEVEETEMLYKVFDFADKEASDVMVPRPEVVALSIDLPPVECLAAVIDSPYTRYPVYRGTLENIIGILHVRDIFSAMNEVGIERVKVEELLREPHLVPETKDLAALLADFRRTGQHMAIVVDEYGGMEGIVTLEDLLEEIVGEIEDEFDLPDESVERIAEDTIHVDGTFSIDDFNEEFGADLPIEDYHTLAGFVFGQLGHAPGPGDVVEHDGLHFEVLEVEGSRIDRLVVRFERSRPEQA